MKRNLLKIFLMVLTFFCGYQFNEINAAKVSSNGDFTIRGKDYNINTSPSSATGHLIKDIQMYPDKTVTEICRYQQSGEEDLRDIKWLFIYSDGSASVGWTSERSFAAWGDKENQEGDGSRIMNWNGGVTASKWDSSNLKLTQEYDAYAAYKANGECPFYLVMNEYFGDEPWGTNYWYLSTNNNYENLDDLENIARYPQGGGATGTVYTFYLIEDYDNISREGMSCDYEMSIEINTDNINVDETLKAFNLQFDSNGTPIVTAISDKFLINYELTTEFRAGKYWTNVEDGKCPKVIKGCIISDWLSAFSLVSATKIKLYGDESAIPSSCDLNRQVDFKCIGEDCSLIGVCGRYGDYYKNLSEQIDAYKNCKGNRSCQKDSLDVYNKHKDKIKAYCDSVLNNLDYSEGGCVDSCLGLTKDIMSLEIDAGLKTGYSEIKCNVGQSVLSLVYNVLKWAKYIVPALVIILSILDFIKAITSQSEDDMKKAQSKFIKRLIVAAIIFLLPLIINFLLKTFDLYNSKCDITDLFG